MTTQLSAVEYTQLIQRMIASRTPAVVLGDVTILVSDKGIISTPDSKALTQKQIDLFKLWLNEQYGDKPRLSAREHYFSLVKEDLAVMRPDMVFDNIKYLFDKNGKYIANCLSGHNNHTFEYVAPEGVVVVSVTDKNMISISLPAGTVINLDNEDTLASLLPELLLTVDDASMLIQSSALAVQALDELIDNIPW